MLCDLLGAVYLFVLVTVGHVPSFFTDKVTVFIFLYKATFSSLKPVHYEGTQTQVNHRIRQVT